MELDPSPEPPAPPPLGAAALAGDLGAVLELVRGGADLNTPAQGGRTPLMLALAPYVGEAPARSGPGPEPLAERRRRTTKLRIAHFLVERGADVRRSTDLGMTALHYGVTASGDERSILPIVRTLVKRGAPVDARTSTGLTPLRMAVEAARPRVVDVLVRAGADPLAADDSGGTPLGVAESAGRADIVRKLKKAR